MPGLTDWICPECGAVFPADTHPPDKHGHLVCPKCGNVLNL